MIFHITHIVMNSLKADSLPFPETHPECSAWCYCIWYLMA